QLPAQIDRSPSLSVRDRLAWLVPPFEASSLLDVLRTRPRQQLLTQESRALWAWLAKWDHYRSHDPLANTTFYFEGFLEYTQLSGAPVVPLPHVEFRAPDDVQLTADHPVADYPLQITLVEGQGVKRTLQLRVFSPDSDWLKIRVPGMSEDTVNRGAWPLVLDD